MPTAPPITSALPSRSNSEAEIEELIAGGRARAAVIIPPDYAERLAEGDAHVAFILDGSDPTSASTALSAAQLISQAHATGILTETIARTGMNLRVKPPVQVHTTVWYNPDMISAYYSDPGRDRHDPVCHRRHPDRHLGRA